MDVHHVAESLPVDDDSVPTLTNALVHEALPAGQFLEATIESGDGVLYRSNAVIFRPEPDMLRPYEPPPEWGNVPVLVLRWIETAAPLYAGHPGSLWPVTEITAVGDSVVQMRGPSGVTTFRTVEPGRAAWLAGAVDTDAETERHLSVASGAPTPLLPLNRKERFYTGTVLPMLVASDNFARLGDFLALCGLADTPVDPDDVQFFTDYGFAESVSTDDDKVSFQHRPMNAHTPDVVIRGKHWLLAVEAKMFHRPTPSALRRQYERQGVLVSYWAARFRLEDWQVRHVLLLPQSLATAAGAALGDLPVVTWEELLQLDRSAGDHHWRGVLSTALARYDDLAPKDATWGLNAEQRMTGAGLLDASRSGSETPGWVGRRGGLEGAALARDVASGAWRSRLYEVRSSAPPASNRSWFALDEFVAKIGRGGNPGRDRGLRPLE